MEGFCSETRTVYEFFGCLYHGHIFLPFSDVTNLVGDILAESYEQTRPRLQRITGVKDTVQVLWQCHFDQDILPQQSELNQHPEVEHALLNTCDVLYGGRNEAMVFSTRFAKEK